MDIITGLIGVVVVAVGAIQHALDDGVADTVVVVTGVEDTVVVFMMVFVGVVAEWVEVVAEEVVVEWEEVVAEEVVAEEAVVVEVDANTIKLKLYEIIKFDLSLGPK